ncbi:hypothetical protein M758_8G177800 [Ceratodon purpureus]|uniref:Uncharacterized protein n=1 Tax=Ceratodon purpureus TaxID=3225 RepID=A0A8T0H8D2_CERPU|nr:hypothetical protein KC19_8G182700 [Ceratodon purpureus]KAG0609347.1 hypothetical protein M758_8G177800 [Ceratodon purpureus]
MQTPSAAQNLKKSTFANKGQITKPRSNFRTSTLPTTPTPHATHSNSRNWTTNATTEPRNHDLVTIHDRHPKSRSTRQLKPEPSKKFPTPPKRNNANLTS